MFRQFDDGKVAFADRLLQLVVSDTYQTIDQRAVVSGSRMWRRSSHRVCIALSNAVNVEEFRVRGNGVKKI